MSPSAAARARAEAAARRKRRQQWIRLGSIAAVAIAIVVIALMLIRFIMGNIDRHRTAVASVPTDLYSPVACSAQELESSVEAQGHTAGSPVAFAITLTNTSKEHPCYINVGYSNLEVNVTSGDAQVASVAACQEGRESQTLLLDRGMSTSTTVTWNGGTAASGCGNTEHLATPGTYVATLSFGDEAAPNAVTSFILD